MELKAIFQPELDKAAKLFKNPMTFEQLQAEVDRLEWLVTTDNKKLVQLKMLLMDMCEDETGHEFEDRMCLHCGEIVTDYDRDEEVA